MIFGTLQRRFGLNTAVNSNFIKFITQTGVTWRKLAIWVSLSTTGYENFSIRYSAKPARTGSWKNRQQNSNVSRGRPRSAWTTGNFVLIGNDDTQRSMAERLATSQASDGIEWWRRLECIKLQQNGGHIEYLNERKISLSVQFELERFLF